MCTVYAPALCICLHVRIPTTVAATRSVLHTQNCLIGRLLLRSHRTRREAAQLRSDLHYSPACAPRCSIGAQRTHARTYITSEAGKTKRTKEQAHLPPIGVHRNATTSVALREPCRSPYASPALSALAARPSWSGSIACANGATCAARMHNCNGQAPIGSKTSSRLLDRPA